MQDLLDHLDTLKRDGTLTATAEWRDDRTLSSDCHLARQLTHPGTRPYAQQFAEAALDAFLDVDGLGQPTVAAFASVLWDDDDAWELVTSGDWGTHRYSVWVHRLLTSAAIVIAHDTHDGRVTTGAWNSR